jgi:cation:H+ antiporter
MFLWVGFFLCGFAILFSGYGLSKYGDIIAEKTGLGRTWVGLVLIATVTSLPELMTGISSVAVVGVPDIAVGNALGSCAFNLLILAFLDASVRKVPISSRAHQGNVLSAGFGILLLSVVALGIYTAELPLPGRWIGIYTFFIVMIYLAAMRIVFSYEKRQIEIMVKAGAAEVRYGEVSLKSAVRNYALNALVVIIAAAVLPSVGEGIAEATGLGETFVGNVFIALITVLPEVVVSLSAVRLGAVDLAIGNLFGSNIFNVLILAVDDALFVRGPLFSHVEPSHIIPALSAIAMTSIAVIGLTYRARRKPVFLAWDAIAIVVIFIVDMMLLYMHR